jgi:hypothetical protein
VAECPVCLIYERVAVGHALLDDLTGPAMQAGAVPAGLGGTIALARDRLIDADVILHRRVMPLVPWDLSQFDDCLEGCVQALDAWLTPPAIAAVAAMTRECRRQAHAIRWAWWAEQTRVPV